MNNTYSKKRGKKYFLLLVLVLFISSSILSWFKLSGILGFLIIFIPVFTFEIIWTNYFEKK
ncbi:hypothetical protein Clocl_0883 [Acetivibrio clariflavus DSM 19732]|uniref:Uncharacterized protein n=1 Tax=Acetivibrio clariflavus (strain DSM 19732 / NBRC 101661 / EBR45) TaxID=720554 RepID=G8LWD9_ACECE|nr:hypothetical protein Clocl_0883 [Acetivibrio clariflavus DSM 19732]